MSTMSLATSRSPASSDCLAAERPKVLLFEDEIGQREDFKQVLEVGGHVKVIATGSVAESVKAWQSQCFSAAVLDLRTSETEDEQKQATNLVECDSGMAGERLARWIRQHNEAVPIFGMTLSNAKVNATNHPANDWFLDNANAGRPFGIYDKATQFVTLRYHLFRALNLQFKVKVFLVHGNDETWLKVFQELANDFGFEPVILTDIIRRNRDWLTMIEEEVNRSTIAWIIHTGDDWGMPRKSKEEPTPELRTRPNVLFEQGYLYGRFGRGSGRVFVFQCGSVVLPTDIKNLACTAVISSHPIPRNKVEEIRSQMGDWDPDDPEKKKGTQKRGRGANDSG